MVTCKRCYTPMGRVLSFSKDGKEKYYKCTKCKSETKRQKVKDEDLDFREELNRASINKH